MRTVLVTGGTAGVGRATGLAFAAQGARVALTCRWGSADEDELRAAYAALDAPEPLIVEADAGNDEDTERLVRTLGEAGFGGVDVVVSNVGFAQVVRSIDELDRRGLLQSIGTSAWPLVSHPRALHRAFGRWPRYVVGVSSQGARDYHCNYDAAGSAKAVLETLVRYLAHRLAPVGTRVNAVRPRFVDTASLRATVGDDFPDFVRQWPQPGQFTTPEEVADVIVALSSGWLDGMTGQVVDVDHGCAFSDNLLRLHADHRGGT
ncbi:MAG: SDR family oxidoreductase [Myxococcales bacterium]|nr:SDR family oxidoreductase [Myxococcales bacterium]